MSDAKLERLLVSYADLAELGIPFTREYIRRLIIKGKFPRSIRLGTDGQNGHVFWRYSDIKAWSDARFAASEPRPMKRPPRLEPGPTKAQAESLDTRKAGGARVSRDAGKEARP
jgi:predicted DNA-binding transcriptional regulator AlpA